MFAFFRGIRLDQENLRMNGVGGGFSRFGVEGHQAKQKEKIHKCGWCCRQAPVDAPSCPCGWWVLSHARLAAGSVLCGWNSPYAAITGWSRVWDRGRAGVVDAKSDHMLSNNHIPGVANLFSFLHSISLVLGNSSKDRSPRCLILEFSSGGLLGCLLLRASSFVRRRPRKCQMRRT